jgi:signal transduction histidine kinase/phage shock protein PspC (stress-responsive transcriptional regulator)
VTSQLVEEEKATPEVYAGRRLHRSASHKIAGGVAGGLAEHLNVPVLWVRAGFTVLTAIGYIGPLAYMLLWMFAAQAPPEEKAVEEDAKERQQGIALLALGVGLFIVISLLSGSLTSWLIVPITVGIGGGALVWREADAAQRRKWRDGARTGVTGFLGGGSAQARVRLIVGVLLVCSGIGLFLFQQISPALVPPVLIGMLATLVGVGVITVPWWLRLVRDLDDERRARIRDQEREEIAAHLHDSVLQTLALIQKQADSPREVIKLARSQERQLRTWLYGPTGYGRGRAAAAEANEAAEAPVSYGTLHEAIAVACGEIEDTFDVTVEQVVVGDCPMDVRLTALVQATREAVVNSAKHSGVGEVSVYAEIEPDTVTVFVRDRGKGFDPEQVPDDRHGLADSIRGRMDRHGGKLRLRTSPGEGTEVQLEMPRKKEAKA